MHKRLLDRSNRVLTFIVQRHQELMNLAINLGQVGLNFWLAVSLKTDPKTQRNSNAASNPNQQNALHQQMGLVTTPVKQSPLTTAHLISMQGNHGNYNFGVMYPDLVRAMVTLYLITAMIHTVHSKLRVFFLDHRQRKPSTILVVTFIIILAIFDVAVVNDLIIITNNDHSMQSLAVNDVYTSGSSSSKTKSKEFQQYTDYFISSLIQLYRWVQMFFLGSSLWNKDLRPFIRGRKGINNNHIKQIEQPFEEQIPPQPLLTPKQSSSMSKNGKKQHPQRQSFGKRKSQQHQQQQNHNQLQVPTLNQRNTSISSQESSLQPILLSKDNSQTTAVQTKVTESVSTRPKLHRKVRSNSQILTPRQQNFVTRSHSLIRLDQNDSQILNREFQFNLHGHVFNFNIDAEKGHFSFETNSVTDFNKKIEEIAQINNWHEFVLLNVKLHFWKEAYDSIKSGPAKNVIKAELMRVISMYSLSLMNETNERGFD